MTIAQRRQVVDGLGRERRDIEGEVYLAAAVQRLVDGPSAQRIREIRRAEAHHTRPLRVEHAEWVVDRLHFRTLLARSRERLGEPYHCRGRPLFGGDAGCELEDAVDDRAVVGAGQWQVVVADAAQCAGHVHDGCLGIGA